MGVTLESTKTLLVYESYLVAKGNHKNMLNALWSAPKGMVFQQPHEEDDQHPEVLSFLIHDTASFNF